MKYHKCVSNSQRLENFLTSNNPYDLDVGMIWSWSPQGEDYWETIYLYLCRKSTPPNLEEAKKYIKKFLCILPKIFEDEAEWE